MLQHSNSVSQRQVGVTSFVKLSNIILVHLLYAHPCTEFGPTKEEIASLDLSLYIPIRIYVSVRRGR